MSMKAELGYVIDSTNPDIIVEAREIWLSSIAISSSDFFPAEYTAYHKDRVTGHIAMVVPCWLIKVLTN